MSKPDETLRKAITDVLPLVRKPNKSSAACKDMHFFHGNDDLLAATCLDIVCVQTGGDAE